MMVVPSAGNRRGGGKELPISKGEILEVIQFTNEEKLLCRNTKGKCMYILDAKNNILLFYVLAFFS